MVRRDRNWHASTPVSSQNLILKSKRIQYPVIRSWLLYTNLNPTIESAPMHCFRHSSKYWTVRTLMMKPSQMTKTNVTDLQWWSKSSSISPQPVTWSNSYNFLTKWNLTRLTLPITVAMIFLSHRPRRSSKFWKELGEIETTQWLLMNRCFVAKSRKNRWREVWYKPLTPPGGNCSK
jgi:hypothetical protein